MKISARSRNIGTNLLPDVARCALEIGLAVVRMALWKRLVRKPFPRSLATRGHHLRAVGAPADDERSETFVVDLLGLARRHFGGRGGERVLVRCAHRTVAGANNLDNMPGSTTC